MSRRCINCFEEYDEELELCPHCGYATGDGPKEPYALMQGMVLKGRYHIGKVIGVGGFGITYKAWDEKLEIVVAIKEYYPSGLVNRVPGTKEVILYAVNRKNIYDHGLTRFLDEARNMAKFNSHKNIVNVYEYFEENGTAYIAMEFLGGLALDQYLQVNTVTLEESLNIIYAVGNALKEIHSQGIIHRDISPDNIFMCRNGAIKLLDFGAARFSQDEDKQLTIILKPGYAPPEQYEKINTQGPWTDIYALGATLYLMLTGEKPEESTNRKIADSLPAPHEVNPDIPVYISNSVMKAMAIDVHLRFQTIEEFEKGLKNQRKVLTVRQEKKRRRRRRNIGVMAALGVVAIGAGYFWVNWKQQEEEETLPDVTISFWYQLTGEEDADEAKTTAYEAIIAEFLVSFPNVTVNTESYAGNEYYVKLEEAYAAGYMPNMYESEGVKEKLLSSAADLSSIAKTDDAAACYFLEQYQQWFPEKKQLPLGFALPAVYVNNTLTEGVLTAVSEAGELTAEMEEGLELYALNEVWRTSYQAVLGEDFIKNNSFAAADIFYQGEAIYFLGSTVDYLQVQASLPARYNMLPLEGSGIPGRFSYLWSINNGTKNENKAANRLLQYMLSENAQDQLHIQNTSNYLPLNKNTLSVLESVYLDYSKFFDNLQNVTFYGET